MEREMERERERERERYSEAGTGKPYSSIVSVSRTEPSVTSPPTLSCLRHRNLVSGALSYECMRPYATSV